MGDLVGTFAVIFQYQFYRNYLGRACSGGFSRRFLEMLDIQLMNNSIPTAALAAVANTT